ncbi:MAG TPA: hypothetical protein VFJ19_08995 [Nocardioidaceae bacterium]|nr:hypothetical protein [Nocardioidaceae bacterium]
MALEREDTPREWLVVVRKPGPDAPPDADFTVLNVRRLSRAETAASADAIRFVHGLTVGGALQELRGASDRFFGEVERLESRPYSQNAHPGAALALEASFKSWLSSFASYADRTKAWISREIGKDTEEFRAFGRWLSQEFDSNFSYRLCCSLRNASEHAGRVINALSFSSHESEPGGPVEENVTIRLDCPALAERFPKMPAKTRVEMLSVTHQLELEWIVGAAIQSCQWVNARLFVALGDRLRSASDVIERFDAEVGGQSSFETTGYFDFGDAPSGRTKWHLRVNRGDLAAVARQGLLDSERMLATRLDAPALVWQDFVDREAAESSEAVS